MMSLKLCMLVTLCTAAPLIGDDAAELRRRLLTEGVVAQRSSRQRLIDGCRFRYRFEVFRNSGESRTLRGVEESQAFFSFPNRILEISSFKDGVPSGGTRVDGVNKDYQFQLRRPTQDTPWSVGKLSTSGLLAWLQSGTSVKLERLTEQQLIGHDVIPAWDVYNWPVDQLLTSPSINITDVHRDDKKRVSVTFAGDIPTLEIEGSILGGTVWLSPERSWTVDEYTVDVTFKTGKAGIKYQKAGSMEWSEIEGCSVPRDVSFRNYSNGKLTVEQRWSFSDWGIETFAPERFHLSHYGLPEPGFPQREGASRAGHWRVLLWANAVGAVLIGAALLIRFRFGRRSSDS
jgi:hypothetical protein